MATLGHSAEFQSSQPGSGDATHLWQGIHDEIVQRIQSGQYPPGSLLPSNAIIQQQWKVSSATSRKVLTELANGGWAISQGTRGYIVTAGHDVQYRLGDVIEEAQAKTEAELGAPPLPRPHHTVAMSGSIPPVLTTVTSVDVRHEPAPAEVAHALALPAPGAPLLVRRQVLTDSTGTVPVELWTAYLPITADSPLTRPEAIDTTWPQALAAHTGQAVTTAESQIAARHPDAYEAYGLHVPATSIVLTRTTTFHSPTQPLSVTITVWPADSTRLTVDRYPVS